MNVCQLALSSTQEVPQPVGPRKLYNTRVKAASSDVCQSFSSMTAESAGPVYCKHPVCIAQRSMVSGQSGSWILRERCLLVNTGDGQSEVSADVDQEHNLDNGPTAEL